MAYSRTFTNGDFFIEATYTTTRSSTRLAHAACVDLYTETSLQLTGHKSELEVAVMAEVLIRVRLGHSTRFDLKPRLSTASRFFNAKKQTKRASERARGGGGGAPPYFFSFCTGVQFTRRSHRALIDRKKHEKIEGCDKSTWNLPIKAWWKKGPPYSMICQKTYSNKLLDYISTLLISGRCSQRYVYLNRPVNRIFNGRVHMSPSGGNSWAPKARKRRGVWGYPPPGNFGN